MSPSHFCCGKHLLTHQSKSIAALDGGEYDPIGWVDSNWVQLGYQIAGTLACFAWSFVLTCLLLFLLNLIPGLSLRTSPEEEELGTDDGQLGEFAYDYVEMTRHMADSTHPTSDASARTSHEKV